MQFSCGNNSSTSLDFLLWWHSKQLPQSLERCGSSSSTSLDFLLWWHSKQLPQSLERCDELLVKGSGLANTQGCCRYIPPHKHLTTSREAGGSQGIRGDALPTFWGTQMWVPNKKQRKSKESRHIPWLVAL
jgi:hypothetical protein